MVRRYLAFDIEIVKPIPPGAIDWRVARPLGISCAATLTAEGQLTIWHGRDAEGEIADQLSQNEASLLVDSLWGHVKNGYTLLTWNGLGFDLDILAEESVRLEDCRSLALDHVDMMFHVFCTKGFGLALDTAARGLGVPGKPAGMRGELAPIYWAEGRRTEVLQYVGQDVRITLDIARTAEEEEGLSWTSQRGSPQWMPLSKGWLTVREALELPLPDTSWMRKPIPRSKFTGWLK